MIPLLLVGLTVLVLTSLVQTGERRQARGAEAPLVPPPPPPIGSDIVYTPEED